MSRPALSSSDSLRRSAPDFVIQVSLAPRRATQPGALGPWTQEPYLVVAAGDSWALLAVVAHATQSHLTSVVLLVDRAGPGGSDSTDLTALDLQGR